MRRIEEKWNWEENWEEVFLLCTFYYSVCYFSIFLLRNFIDTSKYVDFDLNRRKNLIFTSALPLLVFFLFDWSLTVVLVKVKVTENKKKQKKELNKLKKYTDVLFFLLWRYTVLVMLCISLLQKKKKKQQKRCLFT